jgi:hypothetical protein
MERMRPDSPLVAWTLPFAPTAERTLRTRPGIDPSTSTFASRVPSTPKGKEMEVMVGRKNYELTSGNMGLVGFVPVMWSPDASLVSSNTRMVQGMITNRES